MAVTDTRTTGKTVLFTTATTHGPQHAQHMATQTATWVRRAEQPGHKTTCLEDTQAIWQANTPTRYSG